MNNQSPFLPQSSATEQKNQARARVKIAVFFVLAVNGIGLMALLMQGCRQEKPTAEADVTTNPPPTEVATPAPDTNAPVATATNPPIAETPTPPPTPPTPPPATESEYTIVQGDTLGAIAKKNHVTLQALEAANPGIEPTKLKIGQKIHLPSPTTSAVATSAGTAPTESASGEQVYTVKSGDTLLKIASLTGASVKAIRSENSLKTDKIVVGQKLKIPAKAASTPALTPSAPSNTDSASIMPVSTTAPPTTAPTR